jgi:hypothetical protein
MARRRIMADRFYTDDYTAEFYTQWGLDYNVLIMKASI